MASLKERLKETCVCGHHGSEHTAVDRGSYIALDRCAATDETKPCGCEHFVRAYRPGNQSHPGHGRYSKKHYRI